MTLEYIMQYEIWAVPPFAENSIKITLESRNDGRRATQELLRAAACVWEELATGGAYMQNTHPTTGESAEEFRAKL